MRGQAQKGEPRIAKRNVSDCDILPRHLCYAHELVQGCAGLFGSEQCDIFTALLDYHL